MTTAGGLVVAALLVACGSPPSPAYTRETRAAGAAQRRGEYAAAALHYERAAESAKSRRDADEARYRAAGAHARAGDSGRARALLRSLAGDGASERAARADFDLATLAERDGDTARAVRLRAAAIRRHPGSGLARNALEQQLRYLRAEGGSAAALAYLRTESAALDRTELAEALVYRAARELDDAGRAPEALDAYLACADRFPYPGGAYWDDALFRAAQKELELDRPRRAVQHLERLLSAQESATFTGSYERARYAEAQLELGRIYRDELGDPARARSELRKVWLNHPKSTLADDALFQEALLAKGAGDAEGACDAIDALVRHRPESRFAPCAHLVCERISPTARPCHAYIRQAAGLP